jgi:lipopolysaccharide/colanic/teichoic acid biosynthesis glycosyltransferase
MALKRLFDFVVSLIGLLVLMPILFFITILIKIRMSGPVFFTQNRVGQDGDLFTIVKFRTMTVNHGGSTTSVKGESRITPLGQTLRKYKLDELPELWIVLTGKMSIVGPRPDVQGYADELEGEDRRILKLRPGITGPASLAYAKEEEMLANVDDPARFNNEVIYPDKIRINLDYYYSHTMWGDIKIILKTILRKY